MHTDRLRKGQLPLMKYMVLKASNSWYLRKLIKYVTQAQSTCGGKIIKCACRKENRGWYNIYQRPAQNKSWQDQAPSKRLQNALCKQALLNTLWIALNFIACHSPNSASVLLTYLLGSETDKLLCGQILLQFHDLYTSR